MEKSLMTKILEANRETKREERFDGERGGGICVFVFVFECDRRRAVGQEGERYM